MCIAYFRYYSLDERICYLLNKMTQKNELIKKTLVATDYGHPERAFFLKKKQTFGLGQTNWAEKFWGICGTHFWPILVLWGSYSMFSINQPLFLQKI